MNKKTRIEDFSKLKFNIPNVKPRLDERSIFKIIKIE
tara:strand:+ start:382 stop:492 length:111 start_codon:yes stop_codon:yes gene_type:complete